LAKQQDGSTEPLKWFEIVNWKKAQPKMKGRGNTWCKAYTSLLEHDGYASLDDPARNLILMLGLYAARTGRHILPADPKWLWRQMPILNSEPNLRPLLETRDLYGQPTPFLRLCQAPGADGSDQDETTQPPADSGDDGDSGAAAGPKTRKRTAKKKTARKKTAKKPAAGKSAKTAKSKKTEKREEKREEQRRPEENREDPAPLRASDHPEQERKSLSGFPKEGQTQSTADQSSPEQPKAHADQNSPEPEKPESPTKSDAGQAKVHHVPRPARSARTRKPQAIGAILGQRFEPWWQDPDCEAFGWQIAGALGYSTDRNNVQSRNQWGNFAAWLWRVKQAAPSIVVEGLRDKAVAKANEILTKRRKRVKNPGAVWTFIMGKELAAHGVRLADPRAGPEAASN